MVSVVCFDFKTQTIYIYYFVEISTMNRPKTNIISCKGSKSLIVMQIIRNNLEVWGSLSDFDVGFNLKNVCKFVL